MKNTQAKIEGILLDGSMRITCPPEMIPSPGQYLLAHKPASNAPLPVSVFYTDSSANGFRCAPLSVDWRPGDVINLRGPIGHGFIIPNSAKKIAFVAFDNSIAYLHGLISIALKQNAEVVLVCGSSPSDLPELIEVQPMQSLIDVMKWADYVAIDIARENLHLLKEMLAKQKQAAIKYEAQILIHTPMPCGGVAECGVCALTLSHEWKMICKDGPVFDLGEL